MKTTSHSPNQAGFTLIELSIVLVIIGLIAGGVLVGQDLIKAAEIRSQVDQIESYDAAVNTFRGKYNGIPGDMNGTNFGFEVTGRGTTTGLGDGNGLIQTSASTATNLAAYAGEPSVFFEHLSQASLIKEAINQAGYAAAAITISDTTMPSAKLGRGNRFFVTSLNGLNYYVIAGISGATTAAGAYNAVADAMSPNEAFQIDTKMDDGVPNTGIVRPITLNAATPTSIAAAGETSATDAGNATAAASTTAATSTCWNATAVYHTAAVDVRDTPACQLRIRASF